MFPPIDFHAALLLGLIDYRKFFLEELKHAQSAFPYHLSKAYDRDQSSFDLHFRAASLRDVGDYLKNLFERNKCKFNRR